MSQDLFEDIVSENVDEEMSPNLQGTPHGSSGVSSAGPICQVISSSALSAPPSQDAQDGMLLCSQCSKQYKTQSGLNTHVLVIHKLQKFNSLRLDSNFIYSVMNDLVLSELEKIGTEFAEFSDIVCQIKSFSNDISVTDKSEKIGMLL